MRRHQRFIAATTTCVAILGSVSTGVAAAAPPDRPASCGSPLSAQERSSIVSLSDNSTLRAGDPLQQLTELADRNRRVSETLVARGDRRGLFSLMDDTADRVIVLPQIRSGKGLRFPRRQAQFYVENYKSWLQALHADLTGAPVASHWKRYFGLAKDCRQSGAYTAMVGYNAHLSVDIPHSIAAVGIQARDSADYFRLLDAIGIRSQLIVDRTKAAYNADVGPLWHFYVLGEGLDRLTGPGVGSNILLRNALAGVNAANLANGIGLQNPATRGVTGAAIIATWDAVDGVLALLAQSNGL